MTEIDLPARVARFLTQPESADFEDLALAAFRFQRAQIAPYAALAARRGFATDDPADWRSIPMVPTAAWKTLELAAAPAVETFRSSGTGGERSVHHHGFPDLYRAVIDASFPRFCLPAGLARLPILSLVPERAVLPDSSLAFMIAHVIERFGTAAGSGPGILGSTTAFGARGVELGKVRSWLNAAQRGGKPVLVIATAFALVELLDTLTRIDLHFRLPAGSAVFETGGFKGKTREVSRDELLALTENRLGIAPQAVVREYGMTELTSQCYTRALAGGDPDLFVAPHWMRVRVLDPATLADAAPGAPGLLALFDLANLSSAVHVLTEDLGVQDGDGFRLVGRAAGAELRGCSLAAEELLHGA
jgi:hypothetical protein